MTVEVPTVARARQGAGAQQAVLAARPALVVSAARCLLLYMVLPVLGPVVGLGRHPAALVAVALALPGVVLSARSMLRGWRHEQDLLLLLGAALCSVNLLAVAVHLG